jgi:hypothetical protein
MGEENALGTEGVGLDTRFFISHRLYMAGPGAGVHSKTRAVFGGTPRPEQMGWSFKSAAGEIFISHFGR